MFGILRRLLLLQLVQSTYFYLPEGQEKCFIENVPVGLYSAVSYNFLDNPSNPCLIEFRLMKTSKVMFSKGVDKNTLKGVTSFHISAQDARSWGDKGATDLAICVVCKGGKKHWWEKDAQRNRVQLRIETAYDPLSLADEGDEKAHNVFTDSEKKLQDLLHRIDSIYAENHYERFKEEEFRDTSESVCAGIMHLNIVEMILIAIVTIFQIYHLRNYFRTQKLI